MTIARSNTAPRKLGAALLIITNLCLAACATSIKPGLVILDDFRNLKWNSYSHIRPTPADIDCASRLEDRQWVITQQYGIIEKRLAPIEPHLATPDLEARLFPETADNSAFRESIIRKPAGSLVGVDAGEWGGGLYWVTHEMAEVVRILAEPIVALRQVQDGKVLAFVRSQDKEETGYVAVIEPFTNKVIATLPLRGYPLAVSEPNDGHLMIVTNAGIFDLDLNSRKLNQILLLNLQYLSPSSVRVSSDGILVAMKYFLLSLVRSPDGYLEQWLVPADCPILFRNDRGCGCVQR